MSLNFMTEKEKKIGNKRWEKLFWFSFRCLKLLGFLLFVIHGSRLPAVKSHSFIFSFWIAMHPVVFNCVRSITICNFENTFTQFWPIHMLAIECPHFVYRIQNRNGIIIKEHHFWITCKKRGKQQFPLIRRLYCNGFLWF